MKRAIIRSGGKQYHVAVGDIIQIEQVPGEKGATVELTDVLLLSGDEGVRLGTPKVEGARVQAKICRQDRGPKTLVYKFKKRKGFTKLQGHRQSFTEVMIEKIES